MSWRQLIAIAWTDFKRMMRRKDTLLWLLIMPLPYTYFFGIAFHGSQSEENRVIVVAPAPDAGSQRIIASLEEAGYTVREVSKWTGSKLLPKTGFRVDLPPQVGHVLLGAGSGKITVWSRAGDPDAARLDVAVRQAVFALRANVMARLVRGEPVTVASLAHPSTVVPVTVEVSDWGPRREIPSGFKQAIPGNMVMFVLMSVLIVGAVRLLSDREAGHLQRMMAAPVAPWVIVASQFASLGLLGFAEAAYFLLTGWLLFGQSPGPHPLAVLGVLALLVSAASGAGVVLGATLRSAKQAAAVGLFVTLGLAALGGCWWPLEILPRGMKLLAMSLPTGQAMHALVRLMVWGDAPAALGGYVLYMAAFTGVSAAVAIHILRRKLTAGAA